MFSSKKNTLPPNFLTSYGLSLSKDHLSVGAFFVFLLGMALCIFLFQQIPELAVLFFSFFILLVIGKKINWGIYLLGAVCFFHGWEVNFWNYSLTKNISFLQSLNAPLVDFVSFLLLVFFIFGFIFRKIKIQNSLSHLILPTFFYVCFLVSSALSAMNTQYLDKSMSLSYINRPLFFIFISSVILPNLFIQSKSVLYKFLKLWFWVGIAIALFGLSSLFFGPGSDWVRITPYAIQSFAPLGVNHNLIAEVLVVLIPIGVWLFFKGFSSLYFSGTLLMFMVALATLSRAAWITLCIQMILFLYLFPTERKVLFEKLKSFVVPIGIFSLVFLGYMFTFLSSNGVISSTSARLEVTKMVFFYVERAPWFGYGPGSFIPVLTDTYAHIIEFGDPLDAHGFIQKILLEQGLVGFVFFSLFLLSILFILFQKQKYIKDPVVKFLCIMVLGTLIFQLFNTSYFKPVMWMPLGVALAAVGVLQPKRTSENYFSK